MKRSALPDGVSVFWSKSKKRFCVSYASPTGWIQKAIPRDVLTQTAAEAWATNYLASLGAKPAEALTIRREEGPTVAECAQKWIPLRKGDLRVSPATLVGNVSHLTLHILPAMGAKSIATLDVPAIREWLRALRNTRKPVTVRNIYYTASTLYADAMAEGWVRREANPFQHPGVVKELPELDDAVPIVLPLETVQALIDSRAVLLERRARYALAFSGGLRDGEIAGLHLNDLERDGVVPLYRVEAAVALIGMTGWATPNRTKTRGSKRTVPFHPAGLAAVNEWIEVGWPALVGRRPEPGDYLFPNPKGEPTRPRSAEFFRDDLELAGLPTSIRGALVDFKDSRSSFATWLAEAGVPDPIRKRLMGHRAKDVTERHYTVRDLSVLAEAVASIALVWSAGTVPIVVPVGTEMIPKELVLDCAPGKNRTCDLRFRKPPTDNAPLCQVRNLDVIGRPWPLLDIGSDGRIGRRHCVATVPATRPGMASPAARVAADRAQDDDLAALLIDGVELAILGGGAFAPALERDMERILKRAAGLLAAGGGSR